MIITRQRYYVTSGRLQAAAGHDLALADAFKHDALFHQRLPRVVSLAQSLKVAVIVRAQRLGDRMIHMLARRLATGTKRIPAQRVSTQYPRPGVRAPPVAIATRRAAPTMAVIRAGSQHSMHRTASFGNRLLWAARMPAPRRYTLGH